MSEPYLKYSNAALADIVAGQLYGSEDNEGFTGVSIDTRTIQAGQIYIAIKGQNFDGQDFVEDAYNKGAKLAIVETYQANIAITQIVVADSLKALQQLSHHHRMTNQATIIAITGSNGKTSTKEILHKIFSDQAQSLATQGNLNNEIGVPLTLLRIRKKDRFAIIEMGANHGGEIAQLVEIANPDIVVVTNVAESHLEGFKNIAGVIAAKNEIYQFSRGSIVINSDLSCSKQWLQTYSTREKRTFSFDNQESDYFISQCNDDYTAFDIQTPEEKLSIHWKLKGKHNLYNALAAFAVAGQAKLNLKLAAKSLQDFTLNNARMRLIHHKNCLIYDDTYNANPASFKAAIDVIAQSSNTLIIAGKMGELGSDSDALHQDVARYALKQGIDEFWSLNCPAYKILNAPVFDFDHLDELMVKLEAYLDDGKSRTILIKGSRSTKMERVIDRINHKE